MLVENDRDRYLDRLSWLRLVLFSLLTLLLLLGCTGLRTQVVVLAVCVTQAYTDLVSSQGLHLSDGFG